MILLQAHSLNNTGWFSIGSAPMTLGEKDSTLSFEIGRETPELSPGQWLMDDEEPGRGIVWRVRSIVDNYGGGFRTVTCEHIIQALKDTSLFGEVTTGTMAGNASAETCTALQAIQYALGRQTDWVMRAEDFEYANISQPYSFNGENILQALETVCGTLEDCWWSYDLSVYPFRLKIKHRETDMACEMREGRNISSIKRTMDAGGMYTRIYPIGKNNLHITGDYISRNEDVYGVIMKVETDQSCETEGMLRAWADGRLRRHCQPNVSIQISGLDLSRETGEPLDKLQLGRACRVPLPEYSTNILENIVKMQWRDKKKEPENVTLTLSNTVADVASIVKQERSEGGGSSGRASRYGAKKAEEDHAWFVDTTDHVSMVAEAIVGHTEEAVNWSRVAELTVDGLGIHGHVTQAEQDIIANQTNIEINERNIALTVKSRQIPNDRLHGYASRAAFPAKGTSGHYYYYETGSGNDVKRHYFRWNGSEYIPANVITGLDGHLYGNYVNAGEIAVEINESGDTEAHIDAKKIILGKSQLTSGDLDTWAYGAETGSGVFAQYMTVETLTAQSVTTKKLDASFAITGQLSVDGQASFAQGVIVGDTDGLGYVEVDGPVYATDFIVNGDNDYVGTLNVVDAEVDATTGQLKIWKVGDPDNGPSITFSRATSLSGQWGGISETTGDIYTITGNPAQTPALQHSIGFSGTASATHELLGLGNASAPTAASSDLSSANRKKINLDIAVTRTGIGETLVNVYKKSLKGLDASGVYNNGWRASQQNFSSKITLNGADPETGQTNNEMVWIKYPNSTVDGSAVYRRYYLTADQDKAYIRLSSTNGTIVAQKDITPRTITETQYVNPPASAIHVDPIGWYGSEPNTDATAPTIGSYVQNHSSGWVRFDVYLEGYGGARKSYRFKIG